MEKNKYKLNSEFLEDLSNEISFIRERFEKKISDCYSKNSSTKRYFGEMRSLKKRVDIMREINVFIASLVNSDFLRYYYLLSIGDPVEFSKYKIKKFKEIKKHASKLRKKIRSLNKEISIYSKKYLTINTTDNSLNIDTHSVGYDLVSKKLDLIFIFSIIENQIDDLLVMYKKQRRYKSKNTSKSKIAKSKSMSDKVEDKYNNNNNNKDNISYENISKKSKELFDMTREFISTADNKVMELFAPYESSSKVENDSNLNILIEYKTKFEKFLNFYNKLGPSEKENQIKELKLNTSISVREMLFGIDNINVNNFNVDWLSPESLLKLINKKVKDKMLRINKGPSYYSKTYDYSRNKPCDRVGEIKRVTCYMEIDEIASIYNTMFISMSQNFMHDKNFEGLQINFALAIYEKLINRGYINKFDEETKKAVIYQICIQILKDSKCYFEGYTNSKNIDLISIINSKKYDMTKIAFENENAFGRLKRNIRNKKIIKEKANARKV